MTRIITTLMVPIMLSGCGSTLNLLCGGEIYGGVRFDYGFAAEGLKRVTGKRQQKNWHDWSNDYGMVIGGSIDIPFSFVVDTATLVYTVPNQFGNENDKGGGNCWY